MIILGRAFTIKTDIVICPIITIKGKYVRNLEEEEEEENTEGKCYLIKTFGVFAMERQKNSGCDIGIM